MIIDKFNCKFCGKEVVFENNVDVDIKGEDFEFACPNCYNDKILPIKNDIEQIKRECYEIQGSYYG